MTEASNTITLAHGATASDQLLDVSIDCVKVVSLDGVLLGMNPEGMGVMEIDDFSLVQGRRWSSLWPAEHQNTVEAAVARASTGSVARFSAFCPTLKGAPKHWDVVVSPIHNEQGQLSQLLSISRDVTREVQLAGERALVARELSHRIKNLFAVVDSVVGLSARAEPLVQPFAKALRQRLVGLGRAVSYVYSGTALPGSEGATHTVHGLLGELLMPYGYDANAARVRISGDDHPIGESAVTALALIFNELATNALKYGALARPEGGVSIISALDGDRYSLAWREDGAEGVAAPEARGFGTLLLDRTTKLQLGGEIERIWRPEGLLLTISMPRRGLG